MAEFKKGKALPNNMAADELAFWSAPFSIENIEDF